MAAIRLGSPAVRKLEEPLLQDSLVLVSLYLTECCIRDIVRSILNPHFAQYRVPRFSDMPEIDMVLIDRKDLPSTGAGETPIVGVAPAVSNAIFSVTGKRLRDMPMAVGGDLTS
jgi:CO/xanthine dehydrogenase Mo-binding subunit